MFHAVFLLREPVSLAPVGDAYQGWARAGARIILLCLIDAGIRTGHGVFRFGLVHPALLNLKRKFEGWD